MRPKLEKSCRLFEDSIEFSTDEGGNQLTNTSALKVLGKGGKDVEECMEAAELAKAMLKLNKNK